MVRANRVVSVNFYFIFAFLSLSLFAPRSKLINVGRIGCEDSYTIKEQGGFALIQTLADL